MSSSAPQSSRLGRGLASLMGDMPQQNDNYPVSGEQRELPIASIQASRLNPRREFEDAELQELADSIREKGVLQPLIVRPLAENGQGYEIVAGERRWRASQLAELTKVPVIIRMLSDKEALEMAIIENVQRTDLNPIEEATGYAELIEQFGYTQEALSKVIGKSRPYLANMMRLLKLPDEVKLHVREGRLSIGHVRPLIGHENAVKLAEVVLKKGLNVRGVEALVKKAKKPPEPEAISEADANLLRMQEQISQALGLNVMLKQSTGESGEIAIKYKSIEQFEHLFRRLTGQDCQEGDR